MSHRLPATLIALLLVMSALPAHGFGPTEIKPMADFWLLEDDIVADRLSLAFDAEYVGKADFSGDRGGVSTLDTALIADYSIFNLTYELANFKWHDKSLLGLTPNGETPWNNLHDVTLQARIFSNKLSKKWWYWVNGDITAAYEKAFPGGVGAGFDGGTAYKFWQGWRAGVTAKVIALNATSDKLFGEMVLGLVLAASQKTVRKTVKDLGLGDMGEGTDAIGYNITFLTTERTYKLNSSSRVSPSGYLEVAESKIGAYLDYTASDNLFMSIGPEYHYERKYRIYNSSGSWMDTHLLGNAFAGYGKIEWTF